MTTTASAATLSRKAARGRPATPATAPDATGPAGTYCTDTRCTDGLTMCAGCNGYGVLTMGGKRYKLRSAGKNIGATALAHTACNGSGMAPCGCVPLDDGELAAVGALSGALVSSVAS
ncbi:MAG: hypothetical protein M3Q75_01025 [Gemmatimonadota bacterium]|nr:hypothetical protein [Gemmatimonadota bacterium]